MSRTTVRILMAVVLVVVLATAVQGCQFVAQKAIESATGVKVDQSGKGVTITGKNGATAEIGTNKVPDGWPTDIPVYAGTVTLGNKLDQNGKSAFMVTVETPDAPKTVADFYAEKLVAAGWKQTTRNDGSANGNDMSIIIFEKGDQRAAVSATSNASNGKTVVSINVVDKTQ